MEWPGQVFGVVSVVVTVVALVVFVAGMCVVRKDTSDS